MTPVDLTGWGAAALTLLAFTSRDLRLLRTASLGASLCFITYGTASEIWPVVALHSVLLPVNLLRLLEMRGSKKRLVATPSPSGQDQTTVAAACGCLGKPARRTPLLRRLAPLALLLACTAMPATASSPTHAERMHAKAVESFRQGRFPEAYGRFIDLANAGHPASARYAGRWQGQYGQRADVDVERSRFSDGQCVGPACGNAGHHLRETMPVRTNRRDEQVPRCLVARAM